MRKLTIYCGLSFFAFSCIANAEEIPEGWNKSGGTDYEVGIDTSTYNTKPRSFYVKSLSSATEETVGELYQSIDGSQYSGKRIEFSTYMKVSKEVTGRSGGAAIWIHTYPEKQSNDMTMGAYDCYTWETGADDKWRKCFVVLDVPPNTKAITYAFKVFGLGQVWMDDLTLKIVDNNTPIRGLYNRFMPTYSKPFNTP